MVFGGASAKLYALKTDNLEDQSSEITSTVCLFCLEFKVKLCWLCRAVSVIMATITIDVLTLLTEPFQAGCFTNPPHILGEGTVAIGP